MHGRTQYGDRMKVITCPAFGGPDALVLADVDIPAPGAGEVLVDVAAAGSTAPTLLQRQGHYPPPPGAVRGASGWSAAASSASSATGVDGLVGRRRGVRPAGRRRLRRAGRRPGRSAAAGARRASTWSTPRRCPRSPARSGRTSSCSPACSPARPCWCTAAPRDRHDGDPAGPPARRAGRRHRGSARQARRLLASWAPSVLVNYHEHDFVDGSRRRPTGTAPTSSWTSWAPSTWPATSTCWPSSGRLVVIGLQGGTQAELDLGAAAPSAAAVHRDLAARRGRRAEKAAIVAAVREHVWPLIEAGRVRPIVHRGLRWPTRRRRTASWRPASTSARSCSPP